MTGAEIFAYLIALVTAIATGIVQAASGVNLGESIYDALTVGCSSLATVSGAVVVARCVKTQKIGSRALRRGDLWTRAAFLAIFTTALAFYHSWLMLYWAVSGFHGFGPEEVEAAFRNWHILAASSFAFLHLFLYRVMKELDHPDTED